MSGEHPLTGGLTGLERALSDADEAQRCWAKVNPSQRGWSLLALGRCLRERRDRLAELLLSARPCTLPEAHAEVELAALLCEDAASAAACLFDSDARALASPCGRGQRLARAVSVS